MNRVCPTCKSHRIEQRGTAYRIDENNFERREDIFKCKDCGAVFKILWAFAGYEYISKGPEVRYWG